ncbi:TFIIH subunit Tfb4/p34 [Mycena floridula]|nr:TFIIH subunit Tfb4/p34 [Mycena floridula]
MDSASHLSVVIDISPTQWHLSAEPENPFPLSLESFFSQLFAFLNAHIASKHENTLAVFGAFPGKSLMLYSSTDAPVDSFSPDANSYRPFKLVNSTIVGKIMSELEALEKLDEEEAPCALVGALTKALCYINRLSIASSATKSPEDVEQAVLADPRILVLSVSADLTTSYIPIMNAIFSAQKLKVTIDACQIYGPETVFLQQAAHLTSGSYIYLEQRHALLQYLIMSFLSPPSIRKIIAVPTQEKIDFRAVCFCHKNIVDIGFVCSVCLSIFCQPVPVCSTCRTKFPLKTLQRLNASRPLLPQRPTSNAPSPSPVPQASLGGLPHSGTIGTNGTNALKNGQNGVRGR